MSRRLARSRREHSAARGQLSEAKEALSAAREELAETRRALSAAREALAEISEELLSTKEELAGAAEELAVARGELDLAQSELASAVAGRDLRAPGSRPGEGRHVDELAEVVARGRGSAAEERGEVAAVADGLRSERVTGNGDASDPRRDELVASVLGQEGGPAGGSDAPVDDRSLGVVTPSSGAISTNAASLEGELKAAAEQAESLRLEVALAESGRGSAQEVLAEVRQELEVAEKRLDSTSEKLAISERELSVANQTLASVRRERADAENKKTAAEDAHSEERAQRAELEASLHAEANALRLRLDNAEARSTAYQEHLAEAEDKLAWVGARGGAGAGGGRGEAEGREISGRGEGASPHGTAQRATPTTPPATRAEVEVAEQKGALVEGEAVRAKENLAETERALAVVRAELAETRVRCDEAVAAAEDGVRVVRLREMGGGTGRGGGGVTQRTRSSRKVGF